MFPSVTSGSRFEVIAAAWGGLPPAIVLMALNPLSDPVIFVGSLLAFGVGGCRTGVRAVRSRAIHGIAAGVVGVAVSLAFIALTRVLSVVSGTPDPLSLAPSDPARFLLLVVAGVLMSGLGAIGAGALLSSPGATRLGG